MNLELNVHLIHQIQTKPYSTNFVLGIPLSSLKLKSVGKLCSATFVDRFVINMEMRAVVGFYFHMKLLKPHNIGKALPHVYGVQLMPPLCDTTRLIAQISHGT